jgi:hypothetical protein
MRVVIAVVAVLAVLGTLLIWTQTPTSEALEETLQLELNGEDWTFYGPPWIQDNEGIITPRIGKIHQGKSAYSGKQSRNADEHLAFFNRHGFLDFEVEFDFRWGASHSGAGFIFRAQNPSHYYLLHFPSSGQHYRAKHFWAAISKVDERGWLEFLKMDMIPGIPSETEVWRHVRFRVSGDTFQLWVNNRPFGKVQDRTYTKPGRVGLESWSYTSSGAHFRDIQIDGERLPAVDLDNRLPSQTWFVPSFDFRFGEWQRHMVSIERVPDGGENELVMTFNARERPDGGVEIPVIVRSSDYGRSWSPQVRLPATKAFTGGIGVMITGSEEQLVMHKGSGEDTYLATSEDAGRSWSDSIKMKVNSLLPDWIGPGGKFYTHSDVLKLRDGTLLHFLGIFPKPANWDIGNEITRWGSLHSTAFSSRSADGGQSWSRPVPVDGPPAPGLNLDLTEALALEIRENELLCFIRPIYSPWVWETRSTNGGISWSPTTRGPFPQYANAFFSTAKGVLLHTGRFPGLGLYVSFDSGSTWKGYRIGTDAWAMGRMFEVKPNIVLYVYNDSWHSAMRAQFIRVTESSIEPARDMLPGF